MRLSKVFACNTHLSFQVTEVATQAVQDDIDTINPKLIELLAHVGLKPGAIP